VLARVFVILIIVAGLAAAGVWRVKNPAAVQEALAPAISPENSAPRSLPTEQADSEVVAEQLEIPWALAWLPDKTLLVTERPGRVLAFSPEGERRQLKFSEPVRHVGESGLLGLAVDPNFRTNNFIYLYWTSDSASGLINQVARYKLANNELTDQQIVIENIPSASVHSGGALAFSPQGELFITTGDASEPSQAQNLNSLAGKILRVNSEGEVEVYSLGHRNPQGLAWDNAGNLWATEHGRSGLQSGLDELNFIEQGKNYGWPEIEGDESQAGLEVPKIHSGASTTWAPAGLAFVPAPGRAAEGSLFFGGLRGEALYEVTIKDKEVIELKTHFQQEYGRIRAVAVGPDGWLYITTSNTDGRGRAQLNDDKIIRLNPRVF
jgi:glucose/arabinose dehydrogenase